ncbi:hypothetical protein JCM6882_002015 [Rhodosporidiobolus microsporus]
MPAQSTTNKVHDLVRARLVRALESSEGGYSAEQAKLVRLGKVEVEGVELDGEDDTKPKRGAQAVVECFLTVDESCCNPSGNAHGGFLAWLIDHCSSLCLAALAGPGLKWVTTGVSTNLSIYYVGAAPAGSTIRIISRVLTQGKVVGVLETRIEDSETGKLLCFGMHTKQDPQPRAKL